MIRDLGQDAYQLTYPVPVKVIPPVNGYLVLANRPVLIDGGTSDDDTLRAFDDDLAFLGLKRADVRTVLLTHNHVDHIGLSARLAQEDAALRVRVHPEEVPMITAGEAERERLRQVMLETILFWGVPPQAAPLIQGRIVEALRLGGGIRPEQLDLYPGEEEFSVEGLKLRAIHCPGHTEGLVCLWSEDRGALFSNDHVLETITPNPTLYLNPRHGRRCGLSDYLASLDKIASLPARVVYPGHGAPFFDLRSRVEAIRAHARERLNKVLEAIASGPSRRPMTILEITRRIWRQLDPVQTFLAAREVQGYVEILMDQGEVRLETGEGAGPGRFQLSSRSSAA